MGTTWVQHGYNMATTRVQHGYNMGATWVQTCTHLLRPPRPLPSTVATQGYCWLPLPRRRRGPRGRRWPINIVKSEHVSISLYFKTEQHYWVDGKK